jgi:hypothetical protein
MMHVGRREQTQAGVMVFGVVPGGKDAAVSPRILDAALSRWATIQPTT